MIRPTIAADTAALMSIIESSGQFNADGIAHVKGTLEQYLNGETADIWLTADDSEPVAVAYCAAEAVTDGTWNLLMLWTRKDREGQGHGAALVKKVEHDLAARGARLLIVETSGLPAFETARAFYSKCGFQQEARIKDFFAAADDKIVFTKAVAPASAA
jgi:ribosomal protein S18 acetylase RimI-like enzyme